MRDTASTWFRLWGLGYRGLAFQIQGAELQSLSSGPTSKEALAMRVPKP
jgi:hypothetical protein